MTNELTINDKAMNDYMETRFNLEQTEFPDCEELQDLKEYSDRSDDDMSSLLNQERFLYGILYGTRPVVIDDELVSDSASVGLFETYLDMYKETLSKIVDAFKNGKTDDEETGLTSVPGWAIDGMLGTQFNERSFAKIVDAYKDRDLVKAAHAFKSLCEARDEAASGVYTPFANQVWVVIDLLSTNDKLESFEIKDSLRLFQILITLSDALLEEFGFTAE